MYYIVPDKKNNFYKIEDWRKKTNSINSFFKYNWANQR